MNLWSRLRRRKRKIEKREKESLRPESAKTRDSGSEKSREKADKAEKWIIRVRGSDGKLRHVDTWKFRPTAQDLVIFGPGEYSIQKVGRKFSKAEKIAIEGTPEERDTSDEVTSTPVSQQLNRAPTSGPQRPPSVSRKLGHSRMTREEVVKEKVNEKARLRTSIGGKAPTQGSSRNGDSPEQVSEISGLEKMAHAKELASHVGSTVNDFATSTEKTGTMKSERKWRAADVLGDDTRHLDVEPSSNGKTKIVSDITVSGNVEVAEGPATPPCSRREEPPIDSKVSNEKKVIVCARCGRTICDEEDLSLWRDEVAKCDFCENFYCRECFPKHRCGKSEVCFWCEKRFSNEIAFKAEYCQRIFCSQQCVDACHRERGESLECQGCGRQEEDSEGLEEDVGDDSQEEVHCRYCDEPMEEDADGTAICMDCQCIFCSSRCFHRHHKKKGRDHEEVTWKEYLELPDEEGDDRQECLKCETIVTDEDGNNLDDAIVCLDDDCEFVYCSRRCFLLDHKRKGLDHEHVTWKEYLELPDEDERRSKVVVIRG